MNLFCFFLPSLKKETGNPTHIAHIGKAPQANAKIKALPKSAILPTHPSPPTTLTQYEWISIEKRADNDIKF